MVLPIIRSPFMVANLLVLAINSTILWTIWSTDEKISVRENQLSGRKCKEVAPAWNFTWNFNWDGRHTLQQQGRSLDEVSSQVRYIYLVRHGHYHKDLGHPQTGHLSPLGEKQANLIGQRIKNLNISIHRFVASSSIRASETADIIHTYMPHLHLEKTDVLKEGWPIFPEPPLPGWDPHHPVLAMDHARLSKAFEMFMYRAPPSQRIDTNELIVVHGNVIAYFILRALQLPPERWLKVSVLQGSLSMLVLYPDGHVDLRILGDVGHIQKEDWSG